MAERTPKRRASVRGSADNRAVTLPGYDHWPTPQARVIPLFDRSIKRVHIDMDDLADCHLRSNLTR